MSEQSRALSASIAYNKTLLEYAFTMIARMSDKPLKTVELMHDVMARSVAKKGQSDPADPELGEIVRLMTEMNNRFFKEVEERIRTSPR